MSITFEVRAADPHAHLYEVTLLLAAPAPQGQRLAMAAWIPGSYLVRDFARHVVRLQAEAVGATPSAGVADAPAIGGNATGPTPSVGAADATGEGAGRGRAVPVRKVDKSTWECAPCEGALRVRWWVYAFDLSVRGAFLDQSRAYFNGACLFLAPVGQENAPMAVHLHRPPGLLGMGCYVATSLRAVAVDGNGFGEYAADDFDDLIDHPVEMGDLQREALDVAGVPHTLVLSGRQRADTRRLMADLADVCAQHHALFGTPADLDRYVFLVHASDQTGGGLEHRFSNSCIVARDMLPRPHTPADDARYARLLALLSHEYFHLWHVKRTQPKAFQPFNLAAEQYTRTLWVFEGITSYYDRLALLRARVIDEDAYLRMLGELITSVMRTPGRRVMSIAESSFDAWIKLYRRDENAHNALVSYYSAGSLVALALDLHLRRETADRCSLDDVMRALWARHGATGDGLPEGGFEALAQEVTGLDLTAFFEASVYGTQDPPLTETLACAGIALRWEENRLDPARRQWYVGKLGAGCRVVGEGVEVEYVTTGGAAHAAGLAAGDRLLAMDGIRLDAMNFVSRLDDAPAGGAGSLHAFRRDELVQFDIVFADPAPDVARLRVDADAPAECRARREAWWRPLSPVADA